MRYEIIIDGHSLRWWKNLNRHRLYGPAVEWSECIKSWYIEGKYYTEEEFKKVIQLSKK